MLPGRYGADRSSFTSSGLKLNSVYGDLRSLHGLSMWAHDLTTLSSRLSAETGAASTVNFRPMISEVDLQVNGESAWASGTETFLPGILMSKAGQSTQDAIRAYEKPDIGFFANLPLPRQIVKPKYREGLGASQLTGAGVVDGR